MNQRGGFRLGSALRAPRPACRSQPGMSARARRFDLSWLRPTGAGPPGSEYSRARGRLARSQWSRCHAPGSLRRAFHCCPRGRCDSGPVGARAPTRPVGCADRHSGSVLPARKKMGLSRQLPVLDLRAVHVERLRDPGLLRHQSAIPVPGTGARLRVALLTDFSP